MPKYVSNRKTIEKEAIDNFVDRLKTAVGESNLSSKLDDLTKAIKGESSETRKILDSMKTELTEGESKTLMQLAALTKNVADKNDLVIASQKDEGRQTRKTLTNIHTALIGGQTDTNTHLESLIKTVNGVTTTLTAIETSLIEGRTENITQSEVLATTVSDEHNKLRTEFETFSNNVAESITKLATDELVGALKTVIDEFNTNMVNQFGENFRHLNEAVDRMVEWQKEYRQNIEKLTEEFRIATESIEKSRGSLEKIEKSSSAIVDRSDSIVSCAEKLKLILPTMNDQLEAFSKSAGSKCKRCISHSLKNG